MPAEPPLITGQYTPPTGTPIGFEIHTGQNATDNKLITLSEYSPDIADVNVYPNGYGIALPITPASFEYFQKKVLNENVSQYVAEVPKTVSIPGTWQSSDNMNTEPSLITGQYTPPTGTPIGFEIHTGNNATDNKLITLSEYSRDIFNVYPGSKGEVLHITPASFEYFKNSVLNKNVPWKNVVVPRVVSIPGTWQSKNSSVGGSSRKPKRNRLSTRRKLNKRRRSRRNVNRKNKKN